MGLDKCVVLYIASFHENCKISNYCCFFFVKGGGGGGARVRGRKTGHGRILQRTFPESDPPRQKIDMNEFLTIKLELQVNT